MKIIRRHRTGQRQRAVFSVRALSSGYDTLLKVGGRLPISVYRMRASERWAHQIDRRAQLAGEH
jgi:hypothetical protein